MQTLDDDPIYSHALSDLKATLARARDLEGFLRVYAEYKGFAFEMPTGAAPPPQPLPPVSPPLRRGVRPAISLADRGLSIADAAQKVLRHHGEPMKARAIAETLLDWDYPYEGSVHELRASVGGVLARVVREGGVFTKVGTGTFGLKEWLTDTSRLEEEEEDEEGAPDADMEGEDAQREEEKALIHVGSLFEDTVAGFRLPEEAMT